MVITTSGGACALGLGLATLASVRIIDRRWYTKPDELRLDSRLESVAGPPGSERRAKIDKPSQIRKPSTAHRCGGVNVAALIIDAELTSVAARAPADVRAHEFPRVRSTSVHSLYQSFIRLTNSESESKEMPKGRRHTGAAAGAAGDRSARGRGRAPSITVITSDVSIYGLGKV
ncbi:hypothetical protein EVAR_79370_1 [Eumeta japonica]|uniref:Uncharacterized protein n=1 Tax=Eumeta variegata TaxID=151549 RepID=A0A4C1TFX1_EUMVA|nr:hypothetical protein EVAR_79370_1 [Eumeta japonica]